MSKKKNEKIDMNVPIEQVALQASILSSPKGLDDWQDIVYADNRTKDTITSQFAYRDETGANHAEFTRTRFDHDGTHMWSEIQTYADLKSPEALYSYIRALEQMFNEWLEAEPEYAGPFKFRHMRDNED